MSRGKGDKARFNRKRRSKIERRVKMRALRAAPQAESQATAGQAPSDE